MSRTTAEAFGGRVSAESLLFLRRGGRALTTGRLTRGNVRVFPSHAAASAAVACQPGDKIPRLGRDRGPAEATTPSERRPLSTH